MIHQIKFYEQGQCKTIKLMHKKDNAKADNKTNHEN